MRNLEIIGETVGRLPESIKAAPEIKWKKIVGFRNIVAQEYFGVSLPLVWDIMSWAPLKWPAETLGGRFFGAGSR